MRLLESVKLYHEGAAETDFDGLFLAREGTVKFCYREQNRVVVRSLGGRREVWHTLPDGEDLELPRYWANVSKFFAPSLLLWHPSTSEIYYYSDHVIRHTGQWSYVCEKDNETVWTFKSHAWRHTIIERYGDNIYFGTAGRGGYFYLLDLYTGQPLLKLKTGGTMNIYARRRNRLYLLQQEKKAYLVCVDLDDGTILERLELPGKATMNSAVKLTGDTVHAVTFEYHKNGSLEGALWNRIDAEMDRNLRYVLDFAAGKYSYGEFQSLFLHNPGIWDKAQELLTQEMIDDPEHPVWDKTLRSRLESNSFSVRAACMAFGYEQFGQQNTWSIISRLVRCHFPDVKVREPMKESGEELLEKLGLDALGGLQVEVLIREILEECRDIRPVKERDRRLKEKLKETFHLKPRKKPVWVQEPDWPMGEYSPMEFISSEEDGCMVRFRFRDVDTEEETVVEQYD